MHFFRNVLEEILHKLVGIRFHGAKIGFRETEHLETLLLRDLQVKSQELLWPKESVLVPNKALLGNVHFVNVLVDINGQNDAGFVLRDDAGADHLMGSFDLWNDRGSQDHQESEGTGRQILYGTIVRIQRVGVKALRRCSTTDLFRPVDVVLRMAAKYSQG